MFKYIFKIIPLWFIAVKYNLSDAATIPRRLGEFFGLKAKKFIRYGLDSEKQATTKETIQMLREASGVLYTGYITGGATGADPLVVTDISNPLGVTVLSTKGLAAGAYVVELVNYPEYALASSGLKGYAILHDASNHDEEFWANIADHAKLHLSAYIDNAGGASLSVTILCYEEGGGADGDPIPNGIDFRWLLEIRLG